MNREMTLFASAGVDSDVEITLYAPRTPDDGDTVTILLGEERITLQFYDVESLERLRDVADEGARQLRAVALARSGSGRFPSSEPPHYSPLAPR